MLYGYNDSCKVSLQSIDVNLDFWHPGHWAPPPLGPGKRLKRPGLIGSTLLIPSYFGPTLYTKGGSSGPPYYLNNTWLYKRQILQGIRDTLQGLRKYKVCKKSFVWLLWQLFDNMVLFANNCQNDYEKQVIFKCSQKPQIRRCHNNTLCNDSSILVLFEKVILK